MIEASSMLNAREPRGLPPAGAPPSSRRPPAPTLRWSPDVRGIYEGIETLVQQQSESGPWPLHRCGRWRPPLRRHPWLGIIVMLIVVLIRALENPTRECGEEA